MLPQLPSDSELASMETFPLSEGHQLEFKETLIAAEALARCVCAFLNGSGGYLILGVRDRDLNICGLYCSEKDIDAFLLRCDNIFHQGLVFSEEGMKLSPNSVRATYKRIGDKRLIFVKVVPDSGVKYVCMNGSAYIRLSASNYRVSADRYYRDADVMLMQKKILKQINEDYTHTIHRLDQELSVGQSKQRCLEQDLQETTALLHSKILTEYAHINQTITHHAQSDAICSFHCSLV
jgi:predicted HTH transcriptional regulator